MGENNGVLSGAKMAGSIIQPESPKVGDKLIAYTNGMGPLYIYKEGSTMNVNVSEESIYFEVEIKKILKPVVSFEERILPDPVIFK